MKKMVSKEIKEERIFLQRRARECRDKNRIYGTPDIAARIPDPFVVRNGNILFLSKAAETAERSDRTRGPGRKP